MFKTLKDIAGATIDAYKAKKEENRVKGIQKENERLAEIADLELQLEPNKYRVEQAIGRHLKSKEETLDRFDSIVEKALDSKAEYNQLKIEFESIKAAYERYCIDIEKIKRELSRFYTHINESKVQLVKEIEIYDTLQTYYATNGQMYGYSNSDNYSYVGNDISNLSGVGSMIGSIVKGIAGGIGGAIGAVGLATSIGTAGTGAAISGLSGAAATNATLAWLGGGTIASGGFGIAGGMAVLGGIAALPVIAGLGYGYNKLCKEKIKELSVGIPRAKLQFVELLDYHDYLCAVKDVLIEYLELLHHAHAILNNYNSVVLNLNGEPQDIDFCRKLEAFIIGVANISIELPNQNDIKLTRENINELEYKRHDILLTLDKLRVELSIPVYKEQEIKIQLIEGSKVIDKIIDIFKTAQKSIYISNPWGINFEGSIGDAKDAAINRGIIVKIIDGIPDGKGSFIKEAAILKDESYFIKAQFDILSDDEGSSRSETALEVDEDYSRALYLKIFNQDNLVYTLRQANSVLEKKAAEYEAQVQSLAQLIENIQKEASTTELKLIESKQQLLEAEKNAKSFERKLKQSQEKSDKLQSEYDVIQSKLEDATITAATRKSYEQKINELDSMLAEAHKQSTVMKNDLKKAESALKEIVYEKERLEKDFTDLSEEKKRVHRRLEKARNEKLELEKEQLKIKQENEAYLKNVENLQSENKELRAQMNEYFEENKHFKHLLDNESKILENAAIRRAFESALQTSTKEIDIFAAWINNHVVDERMLETFESLLDKGVTIKIRYGIGEESNPDNDKRTYWTKENAKKMKKRFSKYGNLFRMKWDNSHAKLFICDDQFYVISSFNILSFDGQYEDGNEISTRRELGEWSKNISNLQAYRKMYFDF